jgi:RimJ/RimL family protein N-acetyltransferase
MKCKKFPDEIFCITFNNEIIGTSHMVFRGNKDVQIGFGILPEFWNQGLGYKISIKIIQHIVNSSEWSKKVSRISVVIHNKNIYALKIFAKLGFSLETKNIKDNFDKYTFFLQNNDVPK